MNVLALLEVIREDFGDPAGEIDRVREHAEAFANYCPMLAALEFANARELDPVNGEFWRRLAGSLRKARAML